MAFEATRPDPVRLARVPFGEAWLGAIDPTCTTCDPHDVRVRMAMYRLLVEHGNRHGALGTYDELSPFWGYASQLAWQHTSGRLGGPGTKIAAASWWGACNYALSVVPYVAAMERGGVPALPIRVDAAYKPVMPAWRDALAALSALRPGGDLDRVRTLVWRAHLASITLAVARHAAAHCALPAGEQRFSCGWVRMVDLFAAAALRTDLDKLVESGGGALPSRVLGEHDDGAELPRAERASVRRIGALADRPAWRWAIELGVWRRIMRSHPARADAELLIAGLLGRGRKVWPARARALAYAALPVRVLERDAAP
jgi:hypothetical protein